jgi:hypothetical protein
MTRNPHIAPGYPSPFSARCSRRGALAARAQTGGGVVPNIKGGTPTNARPEVTLLNFDGQPQCTATFITSKYFITAAHCIFFRPEFAGRMQISGRAGSLDFAFDVDRAWSLDGPNRAFYDADLALGRITSQTSLAPATILTRDLGTELVTGYGYGCTFEQGSDWGVKRRVTYTLNQFLAACFVDSGGPIFPGSPSALTSPIGALYSATVTRGGRTFDTHASPPFHRERIFAMIRNRTSGLEATVDRPGFNIDGGITTSTALACGQACTKHPDCKAYSWAVDPKTCYRKFAVPEPVPNLNVTSGLPPTSASGFDLPGHDYLAYGAARSELCETDCAGDPACRAFTYYQGTCFLKNGVAAPASLSGAVSGIKKTFEVGVDRVGSDLSGPVAAGSAAECADRCYGDRMCRAFSFVPAAGQCWLKYAVPPPSPNGGVISGIRHGAEFESVRPGGSVLRTQEISTTDYAVCQTDCDNDPSCLSWNMMTGIGEQKRECVLMSNIPAPDRRIGITTGVSGRRRMVGF